MLIPPEAKGFPSLLSYWLAFGTGHCRGQFKRSPCCIAHKRPGALSDQQVLAGPVRGMLDSGGAVWRPGLQGPLREVRAAAQPALPCGSDTRGIPQEDHKGHHPGVVHSPVTGFCREVTWSPGTQKWVLQGLQRA